MTGELPPTEPQPSIEPSTVEPLAPDPALQVAATAAVAKAEAAATRRRWINLGEFVAVAGLLIAGIGLWLNWSDRRVDLADKQAEKLVEARERSDYQIAGGVDANGDIRIVPDARHTLGDVSVTFPSALGIGTQTSPAQIIPREWYKAALLKATDGGADTQTGTLPILLSVQYFDGDTPLAERATYDIVWKTKGRMVLGRALRIVGFKRRGRAVAQPALDALWSAQHSPATD